MIPQNGGSIAAIESDAEENLPSLTYKADFDKQIISGTVDGIEALRQSIYCRLMTERGAYPIYSELYGIPMTILSGQSAPKVYVSIANAITETLLDDDRITGVSGFVFDTDRKSVTVSFTVESVFGNMNFEEVELNV